MFRVFEKFPIFVSQNTTTMKQTTATKKGLTLIAKSTCEFMGTIEGREATAGKTTSYNGETHIKGTWNDDGTAFELPFHLFTVKPVTSAAQAANILGWPLDRIKEQYKSNAAQMRKMAEKAHKTGKKVNGATAEYWDAKVLQFDNLAK